MGILDNVAPLFVEDTPSLWAQLRLSDAPTGGSDRAAIMARALIWARTEFYRRLGVIRVNQILAVAETAAPTTDDEVARSMASQVEVWLVRWRLMQDLPVLFRDQSGESLLQHNVEAMVREPGADVLGKMLDALWAQIEEIFDSLEGDVGTEPNMQATSIGPAADAAIVKPGGSVFYCPQNPWLDAHRYNNP